MDIWLNEAFHCIACFYAYKKFNSLHNSVQVSKTAYQNQLKIKNCHLIAITLHKKSVSKTVSTTYYLYGEFYCHYCYLNQYLCKWIWTRDFHTLTLQSLLNKYVSNSYQGRTGNKH